MIVAEQQSSSVSVLPTPQHRLYDATRTGLAQTVLTWLKQLLPMACFPIWKSKHTRFKVKFHFLRLRIEICLVTATSHTDTLPLSGNSDIAHRHSAIV